MALITCPECGRQVSDKAPACPNCGFPIADSVAPQPVEEPVALDATPAEESAPPVENVKPKKKKPLVAIVAVVLVVALAGGFIASYQYQQAQAAAEAAAIAAEAEAAEAARTAYIDNLNSATESMLSGGIYAEYICSLTKSVWYNCIYEKFSVETNEYTKDKNGNYYDDFNDAISALYAGDTMTDWQNELAENREEVDAIMRELANPPEDLEYCYDGIYELYTSYLTFTGLAASPTGSYTTYSQNATSYDSDFVTCYNKMLTLIPEE